MASGEAAASAALDSESERQSQLKAINEQEARKLEELRLQSRLGLPATARVFLATAIGGGYGMLSGFRSGYNVGSLQYLAENAHRMPRTKGSWYFYHKRKNYVVLKQAMIDGAKRGTRFAGMGVLYFGIEAYLDDLRGCIDFINTLTSACIVGLGYGLSNHLSRRSALRGVRTFATFGVVTGIIQDVMRFARGNDVWYLRHFNQKTTA
jgi:hypothetical protein